ncbi:ferritin-like domain-containing protein [Salipaludibacillus sp. HK11]|uniref:ferritin-like domain-containing protein n=1 Tax=Salipaludibacillus sp. HK11 TaxID=3394320 RepID=UPI0039FDC112
MDRYSQWVTDNDYEGFLDKLQMVINHKYSTKYGYQKLVNAEFNTRQQVVILRNILNDEVRHYQQFATMYLALTGREPVPNISREWLEDDPEVFFSSYLSEQKNVSIYNELSERAPTPLFREQFKRASADEQNHAIWFLSFLTVN